MGERGKKRVMVSSKIHRVNERDSCFPSRALAEHGLSAAAREGDAIAERGNGVRRAPGKKVSWRYSRCERLKSALLFLVVALLLIRAIK